jgi:hypothetical protein
MLPAIDQKLICQCHFGRIKTKQIALTVFGLLLACMFSCTTDPEIVISNKWEMVRINQKENPSEEPVFWDFRKTEWLS